MDALQKLVQPLSWVYRNCSCGFDATRQYLVWHTVEVARLLETLLECLPL